MCVKKLIFACINKVDPKQPCKFGNIGTHCFIYVIFSNVFHKRTIRWGIQTPPVFLSCMRSLYFIYNWLKIHRTGVTSSSCFPVLLDVVGMRSTRWYLKQVSHTFFIFKQKGACIRTVLRYFFGLS